MQSEIQEIRTATITSKGQVCIPNIARTLNGFKTGSKVNIIVYKDKVELRPMKHVSDAMIAMLASEKVLSKNWLSKEDEAAGKNL
jgi:AbrB family looped-hinge helix DNA binding protein